jgi:hypothetical protein
MDPTPREWTKKQRDPIKRMGVVAAGLERARKGAEQRKKGAMSFSQVKAQHRSEHEALSVAISGLGRADGKPTHASALDLSQEELMPPSCTTSAAIHKDETFSASRLAQISRDAERNRGKVGFSAYDLQVRHRELMQRRAATGEQAMPLDAASGEGDEAMANDDGTGVGEHGAAAAPGPRQLAVATDREAALRRLTMPPPARFWYLLLLWALGGYLGLHRASLRHWRVVAVQIGAMVLGLTLLLMSTTLLDPSTADPATYAFQESYYVAGVGYGFAGVVGLMWARDGYLLFRHRLHPAGLGAGGVHGRGVHGRGVHGRGAHGRGRQPQRGRGAGTSSRHVVAQDDARAVTRGASDGRLGHGRVFRYWLFLGVPFSAHRLLLGHTMHACMQCTLLATFLVLSFVGDSANGSLETAYATMVALGCVLGAVPLVVWLRDLAQLLRGRLGPSRAACPEFWLLLLCTTLLGTLGAHRFLLGRIRSAPMFPLLTLLGGGFTVDALLGLSWRAISDAMDAGEAAAALFRERTGLGPQGPLGMPPPPPPPPPFLPGLDDAHELGLRQFGVRATEGFVGFLALMVMLGVLGKDLDALLRGRFGRKRESELHWRIVYAWILGGFLGAHRLAASKGSWRIFVVLQVYGVALVCVSELYFKANVGDPTVDPSRFTWGAILATESAAVLAFGGAFCMWMHDLPAVIRGSLPYRMEQTLRWTALIGWMSPTGLLLGFHFWQFGRPLDWQLHSSLTIIGVVCGIGARQFAQAGYAESTYAITLAASLACFGINAVRFALDGFDMRKGSLLHRQLSNADFLRVRRTWLLTGLLCSGHQWTRPEGATGLGYRIATFQTVFLHILGLWLLLTAEVTVRGHGSAGARAAFGSLQAIAVGCFALLLGLWLRDGVRLLLRRVDLRGERIEVLEEEDGGGAGTGEGGDWASRLAAVRDDFEGAAKPLTPPASWRAFRTHLGTNYYYDTATEMIHYLSNEGRGNYAVDPVYDVTVVYDSLGELEQQLERRGLPSYGKSEQRDASDGLVGGGGRGGGGAGASADATSVLALARACRKRTSSAAAAADEQQV